MTSRTDNELIATIKSVFPLKPVPEVGLHQTQAGDAFYMGNITEREWASAPAKDAGRTWMEYEDEELCALDAAMAHQMVDGFIYFLPAYLCSAVRHVSSDDSDPWSDFVSHACFQVSSTSDYSISRYDRLSKSQTQAVIQFLELMSERSDPHTAQLARKSLDRYWKNPKRHSAKILLP